MLVPTDLGGWRRALRRLLEAIVLGLIGTLAIVVLLGVGFRKAGMALAWYDELASILLAWLTYYGAALAALNGRHIGFPTLVEGLSPARRRIAWALREVIVIGFFAVVAVSGAQVVRVLAGTYLVGLPWVPVALSQSVIPIGALLFVAAELFAAADTLAPASRMPEAHRGTSAPGSP
jgi:TRAP-type C4-dicarboxylate transport system permease small subunit